MNLRQLYYFKTIAELEHYTRAAEKLYVSQSSLSHAIQELEDELKVEFFVRKGRNIKLTKYGELFLPYVEKTLDTLETGIATLKDYIDPNTGAVTMEGFPSLAQFVPDIIVRYLSETNRVDVRFQFSQEGFTGLRDHLLNGEVDLSFATDIKDHRSEKTDPRLEKTCIGTHPLVLLVPAGHRLAQQKGVYLRELDGENFIAFDRAGQIRPQLDEIFENMGIKPNIVMETPQDMIIYGLVAANHGVAIVPFPLGGAPYNVKIMPILDDIPQRKLYLLWNKDRYMPPAAEYFRDFIIRSGEVFDQFMERNSIAKG